MSLLRKKIRAALVLKLTNATDADARVYASRVKPIWAGEYPLILVQTNDEVVEEFSNAPKEYKRTLSVSIQLMVEAATSGAIDDDLDTIGAQIEAVLYEEGTQLFDPDEEELCEEVILRGSEMTLDKEGDRLYGLLTLNYDVVYYTQPLVDASNLEWFNRAEVEYESVENPSAGTPSGILATDTLDGLSAL